MKALIAVITCPQNRDRIAAQGKTWLPYIKGINVKFFDGQLLGVPDDYYSLIAKTQALCKWALNAGYDRILKLDDDSYINTPRFKVIEADYAGIRIPANNFGGSVSPAKPPLEPGLAPYDYASGGAYWLSRRSMQLVADADLSKDWAEDRAVGNLLGHCGIQLTELPGYIFQGAGEALKYSVNCPCGDCQKKNQGKKVWEYFPDAAIVTQLPLHDMAPCHEFYLDIRRRCSL